MDLLTNLNEKQQQAVVTTQGPLLILAGAGSGKTTVLVNRIAYILSEVGESPYHILAITFTNKAANEMKERVRTKIGDIADSMWIGTFHSICVRILRTCIDRIGYTSDFVIYDTADSKTVIKECLKELNIDEKNMPPRAVLSAISKAKDDLMTPEIFTTVYSKDYRMSIIAKLYTLYQKKLKKNNALDFDDIIVNTIRALSENPDVLEKYQNRFRYIMVDEYQDTNNAQYMLISLLAQGYRNLCVVGDDDQSIYKFRGANIRNILDFEKEFSDAVTIKLEQNYRSTQNILDAANSVIANNKGRKGKNLWTQQGCGDKITVFTADNEHDESMYIAKQIAKHVEAGGRFADCAVLYRINAQSRVLEEMFLRSAIPYRVLAGLRFYDRKEIKDIVAYLRVIHNSNDDVSLKRIINEPKRGIGGTTMEKAQQLADLEEISVYEIISRAEAYPALSRAAAKLKTFVEMMDNLIKVKEVVPLSELVARAINDTGYAAMLTTLESTEGKTRLENLEELLSVVKEYEQDEINDGTLAGFLESVSLVSDIDSYDEDQDTVVLMTIHSAKGLEFPVVFLPGMENGLFPSSMTLGEPEEIEEERRLCYVAITRAKQQLYITKAERRMIFGKTVFQPASMFLKEIPSTYLEEKTNLKAKSVKAAMEFGIISQGKSRGVPEWRKPMEQKAASGAVIRFQAGDVVEHQKFGRGTVLSAQQFGSDTKLEILFDSGQKKILMAAFAKLVKV